jgi:hypothetical protein
MYPENLAIVWRGIADRGFAIPLRKTNRLRSNLPSLLKI